MHYEITKNPIGEIGEAYKLAIAVCNRGREKVYDKPIEYRKNVSNFLGEYKELHKFTYFVSEISKIYDQFSNNPYIIKRMDDMIDIYNETINIYKKLLEKYLHETSSIVQDRIIKTLERLFRDDYAKGLKEEGILAKEIIEKLKKLDSEFSNMQTNTENLSKNFKNEMNSNSMLSNIEEMKRIRTAEQTGLNEQDSRFGIINGNDDSWCIKGLEILSDTTEYKRILELLDEIVNLLNGSTSGATGSTTSSKASPRI